MGHRGRVPTVTVQFKSTGVPLFKSTDVVAMDPDCCCDEEFEFCCDQGPVLSATFTGATGCAAGLNATFALTAFGSCQYVYDSGTLTPTDPCGTACYTDVDPSFGFTRYWHPTRYAVTVTLSATDQSVEVVATVSYTAYRIVGPDCNITFVIPARAGISTFRRTTCTSGAFTRDGGAPTGIMGLPPDDCTLAF